MSNPHVHYLLIGGGVASLAAARAIRAIDALGSVMMVGQEISRPYQRGPLSKGFLRRGAPRQELFAVEASWFDENGVTLRTGLRAARLDLPRHAVTFDDGQEVSYERLLLATGAMARHLDVPGAALPNVYALRTLTDVERLHHAIDKSRAEGVRGTDGTSRGRAVVVGGGLLGVECAAGLRAMGLGVDLVESRGHLWSRVAGDSLGGTVVRRLRDAGIGVHVGVRPLRLEGDGRVQRVVLDDERTLPCDLVVTAIGSIVPRELLRGSAVASETAVLVDARCESSVPDVFAAGDCAAVRDPRFGKHRWMDYAEAAVITGQVAGANMAGGEARFDAAVHFDSAFLDVRLDAWGEAKLVERRIVRTAGSGSAPEGLNVIEFGVAADGRVAQVLAVNHPDDHDVLRALVMGRASVVGREELLKDPQADLRQLI